MSESLLTLVRMQILLHECACVSKHVNVYMNASRACRSVCFLFLCVYECVVVKRVRKKIPICVTLHLQLSASAFVLL